MDVQSIDEVEAEMARLATRLADLKARIATGDRYWSLCGAPETAAVKRSSMDQTGWTADAQLIIDTTTARLAGAAAGDDALETVRAAPWPVWRDRFEATGAC